MSETHSEPYRIVLTGGPCGGKTTCMNELVRHFKSKDFQVFVVPEVPSILIGGGVDFGALDKEGFITFENHLLSIQVAMEETFIDLARRAKGPAIVLCDRGTMDPAAYMDDEMWRSILSAQDWTESTLRDQRYDAVIHMVSTAIGAEDFYTTDNNEARKESPELAAELDRKVERAWSAHKNHQIIDNSTGFDKKVGRVITAIEAVVNP
jgi:predicted ATPase